MSTTNIDDERLQRYFDGELSPEESAAVREEIASSESAAQALANLERLHALMQDASEQWAGKIDSDALYARIERDVAQDVVHLHEDHKKDAVTDGDGTAVPAEPRPALRIIEGGGEKRVWGGVAVGLAAAAAVFLAVFAIPRDDATKSPSLPAPTPQIASAHLGSEVLEVDFGANTGTVFEVQGSFGQPVAVVWIDDGEVGLP